MLSVLEAAVDANAQAVVDAWYRMKQADEGINAEEVQASLAKVMQTLKGDDTAVHASSEVNHIDG